MVENFVVLSTISSALVLAAVEISGVLAAICLLAAILLLAHNWGFTPKQLSFAIMMVAVGSAVGSLFFSEYAQWIPCNLCWWQRVWMYPIGVFGLVALWFRDQTQFMVFTIVSSAISMVFSVINIIVQEFPTATALGDMMCSEHASCAEVPARAFGLVTMPMMAVAAELFFIVAAITYFRFAKLSQPAPTTTN